MLKSILRVGLFCLLTATFTGIPAQLQAQDSPIMAGKVENADAKEAKSKSGITPFHGKLKSVDKTAKTITIGERTIQITADTKLIKNGKPAKIEDAVVGEPVGGAYKKTDAGIMNATTVRFGAKQEVASEGTQKEKKSRKEK